MVGLADIVEVKRTVSLRGQEIEVRGLSAGSVGQLLAKYPALRKVVTGKARELSPESVAAVGPEVVAGVIAFGTGAQLGDAKAEADAAKLMLGDQLSLLEGILMASFPDGVLPFVEKLQSLGLWPRFVAAVPDASGWEQDTTSPAPSKPSSATAMAASTPS